MRDIKKLAEIMERIEGLDHTKQLLNNGDGGVVWMTDTKYREGAPAEFISLMEEWEQLADAVLVTAVGEPRYANFNELKEYGYRVAPGETDSNGWLSGIVKKGCLRYAFF